MFLVVAEDIALIGMAMQVEVMIYEKLLRL
jgi:hypothetical protein